MKMEVTRKGVFDAKGEKVPVGTMIDVPGDKVPGYLVNKAVAVKGGKTAITNPAENPVQQSVDGYAVADKGRGWFVVTKDGVEVTKSLREDDVKGFDALDAEKQAEFVEAHKAEG
ncbi:hypothetical protein [Amorphus sp. MBR-141]